MESPPKSQSFWIIRDGIRREEVLWCTALALWTSFRAAIITALRNVTGSITDDHTKGLAV